MYKIFSFDIFFKKSIVSFRVFVYIYNMQYMVTTICIATTRGASRTIC